MIPTRKNIERLQKDAISAKGHITKLFLDWSVDLSGGKKAWGQFLDKPRDNTQYGIYGTSAAVQVLGGADTSKDHEAIKGALRYIYGILEEDDNEDRYLLFKLAYIADLMAFYDNGNGYNKVADILKSRILGNRGWGYYFVNSEVKDPSPNIVATAAAMLALRNDTSFRRDSRCREIISWLCDKVSSNGFYKDFEIAIAGLALLEYKEQGEAIAKYENSISECSNTMLIRSKRNKTLGIDNLEILFYTVRLSELNIRTHYLFFQPNCLMALYFLRYRPPKRSRPFILRVVEFYMNEVINGGFRLEETGRVSSVDHLWIYRLLDEYCNKRVEDLTAISIFNISRLKWYYKLTIGALLFIVGVISIPLNPYIGGTGIGFIDIFSWVMGALGIVGLSMLANLITNVFRGGDNANN